MRFGCIEAGGTKVVAGVVSDIREVIATARFDTTTPEETLGATFGWLREQGAIDGIGIASFGPVQLDRDAADWGFITRTTKPGWSDTDFAARAAREFGVPVGFDTDVNGAALAEARWGAGKGQRATVYVTVGTGIGGGAVVNPSTGSGQSVLRGLSHPEMGHFFVPRHPDDRDFAGSCPFHGDCLEGLASGPAIKARWGRPLSDLGAGEAEIVAHYLAHLAVTLQAVMAPGRIVLGGGVMNTPGLIDRVRDAGARLGGGYFTGDPAEVIVAPALGDQAGLMGALALAMDAAGVG